MKKRCALILVLSYLVGCMGFQVFAVGASDGWCVTYYGEYANEANRTQFVAESSSGSKYDGEKSLLVKCQTTEENAANYIEVKNPLSAVPETGKYTLKFYVRTTTGFEGKVCIGDTVINVSEDMTITDVTDAPSGQSKWKEYTCTFDYVKKSNTSLIFKFYQGVKAAYVDNVSLTAENSADNIVNDTGFESTVTVGTPQQGGGTEGGDDNDDEQGSGGGGSDDNEQYETSAYQPVSILSSGYAGGILLTWKNPSTTELSDIKIYEMSENGENLLTDDVSVTPSEYVYYKAECSESRNYQFKVVFSYKTKEDRIYYLSDVPGEKGAQAKGTWNMREYMAKGAKYCPADVLIDSTTGHESSSSLKIVSNIDRSIPALQSDIYILVTRTIPMDSGKKYYFSFWMKGDNVKNAPQAHVNFTKFDNENNTVSNSTGSYDWTKKEYTYTYINQNALTVLVEGACEGLWFDDFECYELDENGNKVGNNLISDGNFENIVSTSTGNLSEFTSEADVGTIKLSYNKPADKYNGAKIYQKVFDKYEYRGIISPAFEEFEISGLLENKEYSFRIVPFNADSYDGEPIEFTQTTLLSDYRINEPVVYKGDTKVSALSGAGDYKLVTSAKNNLLADGLIFEQLVGIYEGNTLVKVYSTKQNLSKTEQNAPYTDTETVFTVPEGEGYNVKIFIVESRKSPELFYRMILK